MRYKAGDKVWVRCANTDNGLVGVKAAVVEGPCDDWERVWPGEGPWYLVSIPGYVSSYPNGLWAGRERHIWPRDEDGRQVGRWENSVLVWRPRREHA